MVARNSNKGAEAFYVVDVIMGKYQSGQMGQTVNLLAYAFGGSNPSLPTTFAEVAQLIEH